MKIRERACSNDHQVTLSFLDTWTIADLSQEGNMFIWQSRDQISSQSCSRRRGRPESSCPALFPPTHRPRSEVEKSSWDQNQQSTTVLNSHLQGCWYWDNEETAWQGKHLSTDQLTTKISESGPHKMIFCNFWPIAHCLKCRWTWFPWSARRILSPRRSCRSSNKM